MTEPTPYERLMAEAIPTGRYYRAWRPTQPARPETTHEPRTSPEDAARHAAEAVAEMTEAGALLHLEAVPNPEKAA